MKNKKILIVDDDPDIVEILTYNLRKEGYQVMQAANGQEAFEVAKTFSPDLILLDIMMPMLDGVEACRRIREHLVLGQSFIVFLTARTEEYSEVAAFGAGADDYITKPIKPRALLSRIHALFRRQKEKSTSEYKDITVVGNLKIDKSAYLLHIKEKPFNLPKKEFELVHFLASNPNKVYSREQLLQRIWGSDVLVLVRTVDVHIRRIREKIGNQYIKTVKGVGYKFELN